MICAIMMNIVFQEKRQNWIINSSVFFLVKLAIDFVQLIIGLDASFYSYMIWILAWFFIILLIASFIVIEYLFSMQIALKLMVDGLSIFKIQWKKRLFVSVEKIGQTTILPRHVLWSRVKIPFFSAWAYNNSEWPILNQPNSPFLFCHKPNSPPKHDDRCKLATVVSSTSPSPFVSDY